MFVFIVPFSLFSDINQWARSTLDWVLNSQSVCDWVLYMHHWEFPIQSKKKFHSIKGKHLHLWSVGTGLYCDLVTLISTPRGVMSRLRLAFWSLSVPANLLRPNTHAIWVRFLTLSQSTYLWRYAEDNSRASSGITTVSVSIVFTNILQNRKWYVVYINIIYYN